MTDTSAALIGESVMQGMRRGGRHRHAAHRIFQPTKHRWHGWLGVVVAFVVVAWMHFSSRAPVVVAALRWARVA